MQPETPQSTQRLEPLFSAVRHDCDSLFLLSPPVAPTAARHDSQALNPAVAPGRPPKRLADSAPDRGQGQAGTGLGAVRLGHRPEVEGLVEDRLLDALLPGDLAERAAGLD